MDRSSENAPSRSEDKEEFQTKMDAVEAVVQREELFSTVAANSSRERLHMEQQRRGQSKTASPLNNDPMWLEAFVIDGFRGFVEEGGENTFTVTADSFIALVRRTYDNVCTADKEFSRNVCYSMYQHNNNIHFGARVAAIRSLTGRATEDDKNLISYLASKEYPVHEPINAYLRGLGDFDDPSGTEHKFRLLRLPAVEEFDDIAGFFGRVDHNTHYLYESLPAPGVSALRVLKDLEYTRGAIQANWDLPEALRPPPVPGLPVEAIVEEDEALPFEEREVMVERPRNLPTANLLGWGPAVRFNI
jgi:hypothetical protein